MDLRSQVSCIFRGSTPERLGNIAKPSRRLQIVSEAQ
jgi:hypothetical protein